MAMVLVKAKEVAKNANSDVDIADAVIAVPHWFTDSQRRGKQYRGMCVVVCMLSALKSKCDVLILVTASVRMSLLCLKKKRSKYTDARDCICLCISVSTCIQLSINIRVRVPGVCVPKDQLQFCDLLTNREGTRCSSKRDCVCCVAV